RAGRCGRVAAGICIRLYSEMDHDSRPPFTAPEIRRTNLASVILQMKLLGLGDIEHFSFMDPPDGRFIRDGYRLLHELQALDEAGGLTPLGRRIAALPLDPRLGRMMLAAAHYHCLREILIIVSALSIQDPRERPADKRAAADEVQRKYQDKRSDFLAWLRLWEEVNEQQHHLSNNKFRKFCRSRFLSYLRLREWRDIHQQLLQQVKGMGLALNQAPAHYADIHRAILSGLLGQVAMKGEEGEYLGARNNKLTLFPGSALSANPPKWIMAGELLETSRLYALHAARIETQWIEALAGHLVKRHHYDPHWHRKRAQVMAFERVTLYGLVINARRRVAYAALDPAAAREIFLQALVNGEVSAGAPFMANNLCLLEEISQLENKLRRRSLTDENRPLYDFYRERIPEEINDGRSFERWRRRAERRNPRCLYAEREQLMAGFSSTADEAGLPDTLLMDGLALPLEYHFAPGKAWDGVTLVVPLAALNRISPVLCEWLVPGLRHEKILALIKSLPKPLRRNFVPATNFASACMEALDPTQGSLPDALGDHLRRMTGVTVPNDAWQLHKLPSHLYMHFRVVDEVGHTLAEGADLGSLQQELATAAGQSFERMLAQGLERRAITCWDFGELPDKLNLEHNGLSLEAYPGLVDEGEHVALRVFDSPDRASRESQAGLRRLIMLQLVEPLRQLSAKLEREMRKACLNYASLGPCNELRSELLAASIDEVFIRGQSLPRKEVDFQALVAAGRGRLTAHTEAFCTLLTEILEAYQQLSKALRRPLPPAWLPAVSDMRSQLDHLVWRGFASATPAQWLQHYPRYLEAIARRLRKLEEDPRRDLTRLREIKPIWDGYLSQQADMSQRLQDEDRWLI
ncbi:MAG: ATP-dependent RNA helicase HrpA, partial [Gammaproteobacteria bacterium]